MNSFDQLIVCPVCGSIAHLATREDIGQIPCLENIYLCPNYPECDSYVGCHKGTDIPMGTMADSELRRMRRRAHKALDWTWKNRHMTRSETYRKLSEHLGLSREKTHIGMFGIEQCQETILLFKAARPYRTPVGR